MADLNDNVLNDPMFRAVEQFAREERGTSAASNSAQQQQQQPSAAAIKAGLEQKRIELQARKLQQEEAAMEEKARVDKMQLFAKAAKASATAQASREMEEKKLVDSPEAREAVLQEIGLMKEQLGTTGSGKRVTSATPLGDLRAELALMHKQVDLERCMEAPLQMLLWAVRATETAAAPAGLDFTGLADRFEAAVDRSKVSKSLMEKHLHRAVIQASIKYGSWFTMGPELYLATTIVQMGREQMKLNAGKYQAAGEIDIEPELDAQLNAQFDDDDDDDDEPLLLDEEDDDAF